MRDRDESDRDDPDDPGDDAGGDPLGLDDDAPLTMPCPHCFGTIYDDSERCPHCGQYLSREDLPFRPPWWVVFGVCVCLVIVARWITFR